MKKGFTMIELIFVIVILGILASVAVPRLAATREDAEVSAAVANVRTLISDASAYYVTKGFFVNGDNKAKWRDFTNVPLLINDSKFVDGKTEVITTTDDGAVYLPSGDIDCIVIRVKDSNGARPAYIEIAKTRDNVGKGICPEIIEAEPIRAYLNLQVPGVTPLERDGAGVITFGSSIPIHQ